MLDYLVYYVNEGKYSSKFGLKHFFDIAKCNTIDGSPNLKEILVILLRFVRADDDKQIMAAMLSERYLPKIIQKFVQSSNHNYSYNPVVFQILLKNNFIYSEMQKDLNTYAKFLNIMLKSDSVDISIKNCILQSIINSFDPQSSGKTKDFREAIDKNTNLILTIIDNLRTIKNVDFLVFGLSALRGIVMEKENLQTFLVKEGEVISLIHHILGLPLRSPSIRTAVFSLIIILTKNPQNQEKLAEQLKEDLLEDLESTLVFVDPKQSSVFVRLIEICQKLIKQDSFRSLFNDRKLIYEILKPRVFSGYNSERVKTAIYYLFIIYYDITNEMGTPDDNIINFVIDAFISLTEEEISNDQYKIVPLTLYGLYCVEGSEGGKKKLRNSDRMAEMEERFKQIQELHPKQEHKVNAKKIHSHLVPKQKSPAGAKAPGK